MRRVRLNERAIPWFLAAAVLMSGCPGEVPTGQPGPVGGAGPAQQGEYVILGTRTDGGASQARATAEDALVAHPNLACMVGLFEYNPPAILEALRSADRLGQVQVVAFDENDATLQAIIDGTCVGTIVQDPYRYGYESVRILAGLARGDRSVLPEDGFLNIEPRKITRENVVEFWERLKELTSQDGGEDAGQMDPGRPTVAFVTNTIADFWLIGQAGALQAGRDFNVNVIVRMPTAYEVPLQRAILEDLLARGVDGIAVSPIDPENQQDILNEVAERCHLITQDSDAPNSNRLAYVGMSNYEAGWLCGELVKEAIPDGGEIMVFVGNLDQNNARLRRQGLIDAVLNRERDETRYDPPGQVRRSGD